MNAAVEGVRTAVDWTRWFPAASQRRPNAWRLQRFDTVDAEGRPVGRAIVALTPAGEERTFASEKHAQWGANALNQQEGR